MTQNKILITGAHGQVGSVLYSELSKKYGKDNIVASDIKEMPSADVFELLDVTDIEAMNAVVKKHSITEIYHLAAILSAKGEQDPLWTWELNLQGLFNVLEASRNNQVEKIFFPSSIAVFGHKSKLIVAPQASITDPTTVYGMSKVAGEYWCQYYHNKYGLDIRSIRYPGVIGYQSMAGGGTTDYAVEIFQYVLDKKEYSCFLEKDTRLPMIFMEDAIRATFEIMEAPIENINIRTSYNISGINFTPEELVQEIQVHHPDFKCTYLPDFRQQIAESWPQKIDDTEAMVDWGWKPSYDLPKMVSSMFENLPKKKLAPIQL